MHSASPVAGAAGVDAAADDSLGSSISDHAGAAEARLRKGFGPRVRRLHARIGKAHHQAEGMGFSRALLAGQADPLQLAALVRAVAPAYALLEQEAPALAMALGGAAIPWPLLARGAALQHDLAVLDRLPVTPPSPAAAAWLEHLRQLCREAPHRLMAHVYVRYGGDLSGGQQLGRQANAILAAHGLPALNFWTFAAPIEEIKCSLHAGFEAMALSPQQEADLLDEAEAAFLLTQRLLAELESISAPAGPSDPIALLLKHDRPVPRYTSYPTAAAFSDAVGADQLRTQLAQPSTAPLSLYVHVPFCRHACWYCGCHRVTTQLGSTVVAPYLASLARELDLVSAAMPQRRRLAQLHWGGGTPNYLNLQETAQLWALIRQHFDLDPDLEASIEVNPEFLSRDAVLQLRQLGFTRISFGIQDADPDVQQAVNRVVPVPQLRRVMGWLREAAFSSVNVDLICGLPRQSPERFRRTLELVQELRPDRIALFSFAYLPEQLPLQRRIAAAELPSQRDRIRMLEQAQQRLCANGYEAIGMDHYALADDSLAEAARQGRLHRNFQGYTTGGELDLLGIGPTAISQFPHLFSQNQRELKAWSAALARGELPVERGLEVHDPEVLERRELIRQVMCRFALELDDLGRFEFEWQTLQGLAADGLVELSRQGQRGALQVTSSGRWLIRTIAAVFDPQQQRCASGSRLL
ncbi:MAG: oxygen-independent coproporphyrinogen oxidase [Cyanobacteriota bacterium]